jgi:pSer/pThr/pTyr-binding forkhead associated (FHA) protein
MKTCPSCNTENPAAFKFCGACGANLESVPEGGGGAEAAPAPAPEPVDDGSAAGYLVLIRPDGSEGGAFPLGDGATSVGRSTGQLFSADAYLSPLHATFVMSSGKLTVRDEGSLNGVFVRIPGEQPVELGEGDVVRLGQELVQIEPMPEPATADDGTETMGSVADEEVWGRVALVVGKGQVANVFNLTGDGVVLGRERGNVLFPEDGYVSGTHLRLQKQGDAVVATDLNSSNGTFLKVREEQDLGSGDYILMGQQLFRVDY